MFCSNCGSKLPEGVKFCSVCGARVVEAVRPGQAEEPAPVDFSDLPGADAENKPAEAPLKTRVTFDWSNVIDEPQKRVVPDIKSPWATTGSIDEKAIYSEMKPATDRSRTMSFIDVLKAEKEQKEQAAAAAEVKVEKTPEIESLEAVLAEAKTEEPKPIEYTEVLDPGFLEQIGETVEREKAPELHIAPLYEDLDQPVVTPFDIPEDEKEEPIIEEPRFEEPESEPELEEPVFEEPVYEESSAAEIEIPVEEPAIEEPAEQEYYFKDAEPVEEKHAHDLDYEAYDKADLTQLEVPAEESVYKDEYMTPAEEEPVIEEPIAEEPAHKRWFDLPDFLKPREEKAPVAPIVEAPVVEEAVVEEPVVDEVPEEPAVEEIADEVEEVAEEPVAEEPIEEPAVEEPVSEELQAPAEIYEEEPAVEDEYLDVPEIEIPAEEPAVEEIADEVEEVAEEPVAEEPIEEPAAEEVVFEEPADEPEEELIPDEEFGNTEDEYLNISTERGEVTRSTISLDPEEFEDDDDEDEEDTEDSVDEDALFAEMQAEEPKKTGMTIAAPADKESEIEALKKRLAELMGTDWQEPQTIEKADPLTAEDLVEEPEEQDYYYKDGEPAEVKPANDLDYEAYDKADLTQLDVPADTALYEDEYLIPIDEEAAEEVPEEVAEAPAEEVPEEVAEAPAEEPVDYDQLVNEYLEVEDAPAAEEPAVEEPVEEVAEEPATEELSFEDELAKFLAVPEEDAADEAPEAPVLEDLAAVVEEPAAEAPVIEEPVEEPAEEKAPAEQSIDDFLASILEKEATPAVNAIAAEEPSAEPVAEIPEAEPEVEEIEIPAVEEPVVEPAVEEAAAEIEIPETEVKKESDALDLEDLFGDAPTPDADAEATKKIDKFYTLYRKNEEFQRLLDEEYNKLKAAGGPAPEQVLPDPEPLSSAAKSGKQIEDATIYQAFEIPKEALAEAEAKAAAAREAAPVKVEKAVPEDKTAATVAAVAAAGATAATVATPPHVEYEETDKGGGCLTAIAVIVAILLVVLLGIILLLNFAPDSSIAIQIDSIIENITSHFTAVNVEGGQTLL